MEESYSFIRNSAKRFYRISSLRITAGASPSLRSAKWKNLTDLYALSEKILQNLVFAYKIEGVSVPAKCEMEISYRFIRNLRICESTISHLRTN